MTAPAPTRRVSDTSPAHLSPLRYPGGKTRMSAYLGDLFAHQYGLMDVEIWMEPFGGGLGAGLCLLNQDAVAEVWFSEKNPALAAMWRAIIADPERVATEVERITPTLGLYREAQQIVAAAADHTTNVDDLSVGLAALIVNRCSRSGIVAPNVGPIGGKQQDGKYTVASRFNPQRLAARIRNIASLTPSLRYCGNDGIARLRELDGSIGIEMEVMAFVDPPYVDMGGGLYAEGMSVSDHHDLAWALNTSPVRWALTYDSSPHIWTDWYRHRRVMEYQIKHTANRAHIDTEYLIVSDNLEVDPSVLPLPTGEAAWLRWDDDDEQESVEQFTLPLPTTPPAVTRRTP